jgi:arylsulfatase A-like enzyme
LIDLAPTIYALMGVPSPRDLDGEVLHQAFGPNLEMAPRYESDLLDSSKVRAERAYSPEDEALVMEQLRNLGYVD